jgi:hypothetical protein
VSTLYTHHLTFHGGGGDARGLGTEYVEVGESHVLRIAWKMGGGGAEGGKGGESVGGNDRTTVTGTGHTKGSERHIDVDARVSGARGA